MSDLTLRKIRNTQLSKVVGKLHSGSLSSKEMHRALEIGLILMNSEVATIREFGYRIILKVSIENKYYVPLFDIATHEGYIPVAALLIRQGKVRNETNLVFTLTEAYFANFRYNDTFQTEEQGALFEEFQKRSDETLAVVAPTSYGKSQLIEEAARQNRHNLAIIVPSKALITQTRRRVAEAIAEQVQKQRIIIHHDMAISDTDPLIAVVTQERFLRLCQKHSNLTFGTIIVDEAHNLLAGDKRARLLASTLIISRIRNPSVAVKYLTPFLVSSDSLNLVVEQAQIHEIVIDEKLKSELYYVTDLRTDGITRLYDQYLNDFFPVAKKSPKTVVQLLHEYKTEKNIVYLNKPLAIEKLAVELAATEPALRESDLDHLLKEIGDFVHPSYRLLRCLHHGVAYHHGSVPDTVRSYIEDYFRSAKGNQWIITNSTLLEGVNIPASSLFVLDPRKGNRKLTLAQFRNLVGRVNRFSDIFHPEHGDIAKLMPPVHLIGCEYSRKDLNLEKYIKEVAKVDAALKDSIDNPLLKLVDIDAPSIGIKRNEDFTFIENIEPDAKIRPDRNLAQTEFGRLCFIHNVYEFDILGVEHHLSRIVDERRQDNALILDAADLMTFIEKIFISNIADDEDDREIASLTRLRNAPARKFYAMFFDWRINQVNYRRMVGNFFAYWKKLIEDPTEVAQVFVGKWGDIAREGHVANYVNLREKTEYELINLAIVRIKEEQDFIDNKLIKFLEILNDLSLVSADLYNKVKYGTTNSDQIILIQCGLSHITANVLVTSYKRFLLFTDDGGARIDSQIMSEFSRRNETGIIRAEVQWSGMLT
ncbi:DEAD/DEAH box helicase [Massilia sp. SM-13]|uniref:DEAD/DEAH box helicase n=1 Tax=Pseudoduganella rhizocola TaxID=3382643 RepID=UPI0038B562E7